MNNLLLRHASLVALFVAVSFVFSFRLSHLQKNEISWDILGYYLPLASTVVHDDPLLTNYDWLKELNEREKLSGTLYQISSNEKGEPMYFFLFGWSMAYSPWFLAAHALAEPMGYAADGFSAPYQYFMVFGALVYTLIGLVYFRKVLKHYFNEHITAAILIITVFATNYCHHLTVDDLATVNLLFMFMSILLWNTIRWHNTGQGKNLVAVCLCITMMTLIKPSEILAVFIPLLWRGEMVSTFKHKWRMLWSQRGTLAIAAIVCLLLALPQMLYWNTMTGKIIYDSYKNPGVGLDFLSPHILDVLFSYRKGWLVYTPIMLFALAGFVFLYRKNKKLFVPLFIYFIIAFYIIASWTEWWYGAAFSTRPLITTYPVLGIALGFFIVQMLQWKWPLKLAIVCAMSFFLFLNQFQWWQMRDYIWDPYRTTKEYYWSIFLQTDVTPEQRELLMLDRDFTGNDQFNREKYVATKTFQSTFDDAWEKEILATDSTGNRLLRVPSHKEFGMTRKWKYEDLTERDHIWIEVAFDVRFDSVNQFNQRPLLATTIDHKGTYDYKTFEVGCDTCGTNWFHFTAQCLTPEIRSSKDPFQIYIWNRDKTSLEIDNLVMTVYERRE